MTNLNQELKLYALLFNFLRKEKISRNVYEGAVRINRVIIEKQCILEEDDIVDLIKINKKLVSEIKRIGLEDQIFIPESYLFDK